MTKSIHLWCQRCVRKFRTNFKHVCEISKNNKRVKCQFCNKNSHYCEKDMIFSQFQVIVRVFAAQNSVQNKLKAILKFWKNNNMQILCVTWLTWCKNKSKKFVVFCFDRVSQSCCNNYIKICHKERLSARCFFVFVRFCVCSKTNQDFFCFVCWFWFWFWFVSRCFFFDFFRFRFVCVCFRFRLVCVANKFVCCRVCFCVCFRATKSRNTW